MTIMKTTVSLLVLFFLSLKASAIFGLGDPDYCKKNPNDLLCSTGLNKVVEDTGLTDALSPFSDLLKTDEQKQLEAERVANIYVCVERRTLDTLLTYTDVPGLRIQPLCHLS